MVWCLITETLPFAFIETFRIIVADIHIQLFGVVIASVTPIFSNFRNINAVKYSQLRALYHMLTAIQFSVKKERQELRTALVLFIPQKFEKQPC
jgi:hypothetical protein